MADAPPAWLVLNPNGGPHAAVRDEISRIFMLPGTAVEEGQEGVRYTGKVIGHRLSRRDDRYAEPGSGPWTLLRIVGPGDGWVALNLWEGWGEVFSAGRDEDTTVFGRHLARAIA
ncbi:hypothetical protein [Labilithrix luteola]|uniref:hypothetical protein n=1 Tax=Labilithrix luteola TaxID=1391654 RepID=UPI0011BAA222|nr:hypothetical protein [Labilithrix luteola]